MPAPLFAAGRASRRLGFSMPGVIRAGSVFLLCEPLPCVKLTVVPAAFPPALPQLSIEVNMHHRGILPILFAFFATIALPAMAGNVFVLPPNQQSGTARVFSDVLVPGGTLPVPANTHQVLVSPDGAKAVFLSSSTSQDRKSVV